ncbi:hypothetical protein NH340_JMT06907 [Sarcoptes scabiei]|nr:hypothetical protein NH340_JMT06907 [Sarcoptes scabiei]
MRRTVTRQSDSEATNLNESIKLSNLMYENISDVFERGGEKYVINDDDDDDYFRNHSKSSLKDEEESTNSLDSTQENKPKTINNYFDGIEKISTDYDSIDAKQYDEESGLKVSTNKTNENNRIRKEKNYVDHYEHHRHNYHQDENLHQHYHRLMMMDVKTDRPLMIAQYEHIIQSHSDSARNALIYVAVILSFYLFAVATISIQYYRKHHSLDMFGRQIRTMTKLQHRYNQFDSQQSHTKHNSKKQSYPKTAEQSSDLSSSSFTIATLSNQRPQTKFLLEQPFVSHKRLTDRNINRNSINYGVLDDDSQSGLTTAMSDPVLDKCRLNLEKCVIQYGSETSDNFNPVHNSSESMVKTNKLDGKNVQFDASIVHETQIFNEIDTNRSRSNLRKKQIAIKIESNEAHDVKNNMIIDLESKSTKILNNGNEKSLSSVSLTISENNSDSGEKRRDEIVPKFDSIQKNFIRKFSLQTSTEITTEMSINFRNSNSDHTKQADLIYEFNRGDNIEIQSQLHSRCSRESLIIDNDRMVCGANLDRNIDCRFKETHL